MALEPGAPGTEALSSADEFDDPDNAEFEDEDDDGNGWGAVEELSEVDLLKQKQEIKKQLSVSSGTAGGNETNVAPNVNGENGENPAQEGGRPQLNLKELKKKERCWICNTCYAANSLVICFLFCFFCIEAKQTTKCKYNTHINRFKRDVGQSRF